MECLESFLFDDKSTNFFLKYIPKCENICQLNFLVTDILISVKSEYGLFDFP